MHRFINILFIPWLQLKVNTAILLSGFLYIQLPKARIYQREGTRKVPPLILFKTFNISIIQTINIGLE